MGDGAAGDREEHHRDQKRQDYQIPIADKPHMVDDVADAYRTNHPVAVDDVRQSEGCEHRDEKPERKYPQRTRVQSVVPEVPADLTVL
jgi:hypothetical protein